MRRVLYEVELANTRRKLKDLKRLYEAHQRKTEGDEELREMSMESLMRLINQLKEKFVWSEIRHTVRG